MVARCPHCLQDVDTLSAESAEFTCPLCGSNWRLAGASTEEWRPETGRVGKYEVLGLLGTGGFGRVYRARDTELDRVVALKLPRDVDAEPADLDRFLREAVNVSRLQHPNIVALFDAGRVDGKPFMASELVDGVTLADRLTAGRLTFRQTAESRRPPWPKPSTTPTAPASSTATSSPPTSCSTLGPAAAGGLRPRQRDAADVRVTQDGAVLGTPGVHESRAGGGQARGRRPQRRVQPGRRALRDC